MPSAYRHRDEASPFQPPVPGLAVHRENDVLVNDPPPGRDLSEIRDRFARGLRACVATMDGVHEARGRVAMSSATIGRIEASCVPGVCVCDMQRADQASALEAA